MADRTGNNNSLTLTASDLARLRGYLSPAQQAALPPLADWQAGNFAAARLHLLQLFDVITTYLPRHLARREIRGRREPQRLAAGEFLQGALAFADISGFTDMSERLSVLGREGAEQVTDIVNGYFRRMLGIVFAHGGDVFKFGGDALLVYYPDTATALVASWRMQQAMSDFAEVKTSLGSFPLRMKIGLNTGSIYTARLGTAADRQFFVSGNVVNGTARAESLSFAGEILVTPQVRTAVNSPASPFQFIPGPHDHYLLVGVTAKEAELTNRTLEVPSVAALPDLLTALDRLVPYLPNGLLPRLISDPGHQQLSGEHRLVGTLFANFVGASELIEQLGPDRADEIAEQLNRYVVAMQQAIAPYGGVISKIDLYDHGDKLMAIFGAPIAHEDDAERTLRAALQMQSETRMQTTQLILPTVKQSIGVNAGVVFAGHVGSGERREYTVMGDDVNLAARLMSAAKLGELLMSHAIRRKVTAFFEVADRGTVKVKGKAQPVPIFSVIGPRAQPEPVRGIQGLHSPLVGRAPELTAMQALAQDVRDGHGRILKLLGEAGLGKSRLIVELRDSLATEACLCYESHCLSYTQSVSYSAFTPIIHAVLGFTPTLSDAELWAKLRWHIEDLLPGETGDDILPYLATFLSLPLPEPLTERVTYLDAEALQRQVIRAVVTLLESLAQRHPLLLTFDDLHWADSASLAMLERTLTLAERVPILIALLYRPDEAHGSWALGESASRSYPDRCVAITLPPLKVEHGEDQTLVRNLLTLDTLPAPLIALIARAEGNPFYIEEIIRDLIDAGVIVPQADRWGLAKAIESAAVPDSLQGIIMARIDRLIEDARRTLQLAAVVGRTFRYLALNGLATAVTLAAQLDNSLTTLQRAELIREQTRLPELEYGFVQAMFRDVAYESLLLRDRRLYHRLVGQQLEEAYPGQHRDEVYELLAHHYSLSDDHMKSLKYLIKAGNKSRLAYANKEAIEFYRQAALLADQIGTTEDNAAIAEGLGDVYYHVGEYDDALACFARAQRFHIDALSRADLFRRMGAVHEKRGEFDAALTQCTNGVSLLTPEFTATVEMAQLLTLECRVHHQQGKFEEAIQDGESALRILKGAASYQEVAQAHNELGNAYEGLGRIEDAVKHYESGLLMLQRIGDEHGASKIYNNLALIYYQTDPAKSADYMGRVLTTMQRLGDTWGEATAYQNLGIIQFARGDYAQAIDDYQRSLKMKERLGDNLGVADCHINLGESYRARGDVAQAIQHLETSLTIAQQINSDQTVAECYRQLAECYLETSDLDRALTAGEAALKYAQQTGDRSREGLANRALGKIHHRRGQLAEAAACFEQSVTILRGLNNDLDLAGTYHDYGLALIDLNQPRAARAKLDEALALFTRLELAPEQAKVQAALAQINK